MKKFILFWCAVTLVFGFVGVAGAIPVQWGANGHWYEAISAPYTSWTDANTAAEASSYMGLTGHLATITSAEENAFVFGLIPATSPYWLGGFQEPTGGANEPGANWQWVNGEGVFWDNGPVLGMYANWAGGEPNNLTGGSEEALGFAFFQADGTWNDAPAGWEAYSNGGYVVEYDAVPEPSTMLLFGVGLLGIVGFGRRKFFKR